MKQVFQNPPGSVQDTCDEYLQRKGVARDDRAAAALSEAVAFGCAATAGRIGGVMQPNDRRCNTKALLLQVREEADRVFIEAVHAADKSEPVQGPHNGQ